MIGMVHSCELSCRLGVVGVSSVLDGDIFVIELLLTCVVYQ